MASPPGSRDSNSMDEEKVTTNPGKRSPDLQQNGKSQAIDPGIQRQFGKWQEALLRPCF